MSSKEFNMDKILFSVFTKPWKMDIPALGEFVAKLGFDGIELPVRDGYPVEPAQVERLPQAVRQLAGFGVKVFSIAGPTDEKTLAACAEAGVPVIRVMVGVDESGYMASEARTRGEFDRLLPLLERYRVKIGVQNHSGRFVANAMGLRHLLEGYDPQYIAAVWDAAHNALNGEEPELALDIIWPHLCMVNLKNAYWTRKDEPGADGGAWEPYWTSGRLGLASWPRVAAELKRRSYQGVVCLTAEYSDQAAVKHLIAEDFVWARSLLILK
jgi:sugar phosphate isomerase/epimerase